MNLKWTNSRYNDDKNKDRIKQEVKASVYMFEVMNNILEDMNEESLKRMRSDNIFNKLSWKDSVAWELGFQKALDQVQQLIKEET